MEITFLGTSSMVPTKERNTQAIYLEYKGEGFLIDCGEGTQRQMNIAGIKRNKVRKILISHWHGDHVSGLIGLIQTIGNIEGDQEITLYGPKGTKECMDHLMHSCIFENKLTLSIIELDINNLSTVHETDEYKIEAIPLEHSVPSLGYSFTEKERRKINMAKANKLGLKEGPFIGKLSQGKEVTFKGKKITPDDVSTILPSKKTAFILDTQICENSMILAKDADLLITESSFASALKEKAEEYKHLTAGDAALIANNANVKKLILTHLSQRYKTPEEILHDAQTTFPNVEVAFDFMKVNI
ncbi:ribonuclease Z [Candidatus Woesearchaeota archaeon]|nr:ribonuclease Z [Candidatus Woesearchaeota archaeon]|tara:strand:+ start:649 stop:1548 length:900 start_codon:yes stop_codon:yes gene_type:complete